MKIVLLSTATSGGGAAHAALRLLDALVASGVDARMITLTGGGDGQRIDCLAEHGLSYRLRQNIYKAGERLELCAHLLPVSRHLWRLSTASMGFDLSQHPWIRQADVIHLQWINHGLLSLRGLKQLLRIGKPIFWTLHDLWPLTGGCHLPLLLDDRGAELCPRWQHGCGSCPLLGCRAGKSDLSWQLYEQKAFLRSSSIRYIAVSRYVAHWAERFGGVLRPAVIAPALIADQCMSIDSPPEWLAPERIYLLLSAARIDDPIKGGILLREVIHRLSTLVNESLRQRMTLILAGSIRNPAPWEDLPIEVLRLGRVSPQLLRLITAHVQMVLSTSLFETYGQTLSEALSVGTPAIAFRVGGTSDIIVSESCGRLIEPYDTEQYAQAIIDVLRDIEMGRITNATCREALSGLDVATAAQLHIELYSHSLLSR